MTRRPIRLATASDLATLLQTTRAAFEETRELGLPSSALREDASTWTPLLWPVGQEGAADSSSTPGGAAVISPTASESIVGSVRFRFDRDVARTVLHAAARRGDASSSGADALCRVESVRFERLAVLPSARGHGLGVRLVQWVLALARELGAREVLADARSQKPDSRGFYTRLGFEVVGASDCYGIPGLRTHMRLALE